MHMNTYVVLGVLAVLVVGIGSYWTLTSKSSDETAETTQVPIVTSADNAPPGSIHNMPAEPAAEAARDDLAAKLSVNRNSIVIMSVQEKTWNDGCLGLGGPAESCLQALVDGFHVELLTNGKSYFYRTDKTGLTVRAETNQ